VGAPLIWVIEDNDQNFELVEFLLDEAGHRVVRARDASELGALAAGEPPALVLLDMNLPSGSGLALVAEIREASPVPVFFVGRLAEYVYIDQDEAIRRAMDRSAEILRRLHD